MEQTLFKIPLAVIATAFASISAHAERPADCLDCDSHEAASEAAPQKPPVSFTDILELPEGLPKSLTVEVSIAGETLTLQLEKNSVFGKNTRIFIDDGSGTMKQIDPGPDCSYLGNVVEQPGFSVSATRTKHGLIANILRPGEEPIEILPMKESDISGMHKINFGLAGEYVPTADHNATEASTSCEDDFCGSDEIAPSLGTIGTSAVGAGIFLTSNVGGNRLHLQRLFALPLSLIYWNSKSVSKSVHGHSSQSQLTMGISTSR